MRKNIIIQPPGGTDSGVLAIFLFDALIETLRAKKRLTDAEILAMLESLANTLEKDHRAAAKSSAPFVRQAIKNYRG